LSALIGSSRDAVMPPVGDGQRLPRLVSSAGFRVFHATAEFLWAFMIVATALIVLRTLVVVFLAARFRRTAPATKPTGFSPAVSVLIAAFNEEKVIAATLRAVLASDYPGAIEIMTVDDGSGDETGAEVEKIAETDARVRLVRQSNRGKAEALRRGLALLQHEFVVFLDADTHLQSDTLRLLVQPLCDERVVAVSGHAKVGNLRSFIARCQSLEYTCGFNLDRRAYDRWNCITVVPGAISALRRSAITAAGGLSLDTLAEDTDLTLSLYEGENRVVYTPDAIAWTEAPETLRTLARQRFRWAYGTLQCLWKHREKVFNWRYGALGWFSLPSVWFFQILLVASTPLVDFFLLASLPFGVWSAVLPFVIVFLAMDVILATLACILERDPIRHAWRILPMRLIYRPLLSYVIWKAIFRAVKGAWVGWGKLERTASVPVRV
jgi:cellulose synthase/poly-beta-1,6-N-acetylglucosamine synthase-like glycosyltransferase